MKLQADNIIFFDGDCPFCQASVRFVFHRDPEAHFSFAPLQGKLARQILPKYGIDPNELSSLVLFSNETCLQKSDAALAIARHLRWPWSWTAALRIVPRQIRNFFYDLIARHRLKLPGLKNACEIPSPAFQSRILG